MQYKSSYKKLKINEKDFKILACLFKHENSTHTLFPTFISTYTKIPRTTVEFRLKELKSRQFCFDKKNGRERIWEISNIGKSMLLEQDRTESKIENIFGIENIFQYLEGFMNKKGIGRIYAIEPSLQTLTYHQKGHSESQTQIRLYQLFKKNEHIAESITGENVLKQINSVSKKVLKEMLGRATVINIVPDRYITFKDYIICYLGKTLFLDFEKEVCIIVHDNNFSESIISMIKNLQVFGKRINLNEYIRKIIF